jgi:hypothetical protein
MVGTAVCGKMTEHPKREEVSDAKLLCVVCGRRRLLYVQLS